MAPPRIPLEIRIAAKTVKQPNGCWLWTGASTRAPHNAQRYGVVWLNGRNVRAHRAALEVAGRPAPEGLQVDHLCRNTLCVNPDHLEWVDARTNTLRSENPCALNARKTTCKRGHPLEGENLHINPSGERVCRACGRLRARIYASRKAA